MSKTILIVDDQQDVCTSARIVLSGKGFRVLTAASPEAAQLLLKDEPIDLMLLDMNFRLDTTSGEEGLAFLARLMQQGIGFPIVVMTAWSSIELAVKAMQLGAHDFLEKPWDNHRLLQIIQQQLKLRQMVQENRRLKAQHRSQPAELIGESPALRKLLQQVDRVAPTEATLLISGENGTGKSLLARYIHQVSLRSEQSLVSLNMGAIPENLFESELFGHRKGAFTDAKTDRMGRFEMAQGGTLFLDEIGALPPNLQPKLLRVLESGEFEVLGSSQTQRADVRLIAASNLDFAAAIAAGHFRRDLYYRLNTLELRMPPLRERQQDVVMLARHFLHQKASQYHKADLSLAPDAEARLQAYAWPGNVRELDHVIERAVLLADGSRIGVQDLLLDPTTTSDNMPLMPLEQAEQHLLRQALGQTGGQVGQAGELLGLSQSAMYRRLEKYGIDPKNH